MSITISQPLSGDPFGPGFQVTVATDLVGPLEPDSFWRIVLTSPANENVLATFTRPYVSPVLLETFRNGTSTSSSIVSPLPEVHEGDTGRLRVELVEPTFGVADTADQTIAVDRNTGQASDLRYWLQQIVPQAGTGLTEAEHNAVLQTNVGVIAMAGINPLELVGDLVQAIATHNPLGYGSLSVVYTISGDGELPNEDPVAPKWGVYWVATSIPSGLGHFHGQSEEYSPRVVQWRTVHEVGGTEMVTSLNDATTHGELWKFPVQTPRRLEYSILPGIVLQAQWWQFP